MERGWGLINFYEHRAQFFQIFKEMGVKLNHILL